MKKLLFSLALVGLIACSFPVFRGASTPTPPSAPTASSTSAPTPKPTPQPGSDENPLILALAPSPHRNEDMITAGDALAAQLEKLTGYTIVTAAPTSELDIIEALGKNNAHIAVLSPFAYLLAREDETVSVGLASVKNEEILYGAQFIANRESEFDSFYDDVRGENIEEASQALTQFKDKKPCWSDPASASGYVIPLGFLNQAQVQVRAGAFLEGQPTVVRAVYTKGICDFGATFIDARLSPALEKDYPDVMEKVVVLWRIPAIIPYESVSFSINLPLEMRRVLLRAFVDVMNTAEGKSAMQTIYGIDALQPVEDSLYAEFETYAEAFGVDLKSLLK